MAEFTSRTHLTDQTPARLPQYLTAVAAALGNFASYSILGYSSPAGPQLQLNGTDTRDCGGEPSLSLNDVELSLFSSSVNIGALFGALVGGFLIKYIGRRTTLISSALPFALGWSLIGFANNFAMLLCGRLICGVSCGLVSLTVPTYVAEIASVEIRGTLGTAFQLLGTFGFLYTYSVGAAVCWQWLALACLLPALGFCFWMIFNQESPTYLVSKGRSDDAKKALQYLRGKHYDVQSELDRLVAAADEDKQKMASRRSTSELICKPYVLKPLMMSLTLMFFQQTSGINAILFNLTAIFESADSSISSDGSSIIVAAVQVVMTGVAALLMDRAGRKLLLMVSSSAMCLSLISMGTYFYLDEQGSDAVNSLGWLPLVSLIVFISFFSIGYGPVPWLMMGELFSADVREFASTQATLFNWLMSFFVTLLFEPMRIGIGDSGVYWVFAGICAVNFFFCVFVVKETKGKTTEEISAMFGGPETI